jgi:hypothetical protein
MTIVITVVILAAVVAVAWHFNKGPKATGSGGSSSGPDGPVRPK